MSEPGLKEAERGGPEPDTDLSLIWGSEHLWSSILEP